MTKYKILNEPKVSPFVLHWYCPVFIFIFFPGKKRKHKKIKNSTIYYAKPGSKNFVIWAKIAYMAEQKMIHCY